MPRNTAIPRAKRPATRFQKFLNRIFIQEKMQNGVGYAIIALVAVSVGFMIAKQTVVGLGLVGLTVGLVVMAACIINVETGLYITIFYSYFAFHISRLFFNDTFPVGLVSDALICSTFMGLLVRRISWRKTINEFSSNSVVIWILVLLGFLFIEFFNPFARSFDGWFLTFRKMLTSVFLMFIAYNVYRDYASIRRFFICVFCVCFAAGFYGCFQQWHGLFDFERNWVMADEVRFGLTYIGGDFRKFSSVSDPTSYGVIMAGASLIFLVLAMGMKNKRTRNILYFGVVIMLLGMAYSGTRTANAMFVGGLFMFVMLTFNKRSTQVFAIVSALLLISIINIPYYDNSTINRIRSTFTAGNDESYNVREVNRAFIQPYIYSHPIGGGLATTGAAGLKFNPGHYLAGFPTDSGYLKKALETGWMGLLIICVLYFQVLKLGIEGFFQSRHERIKQLYAASTSCIFSFYVAEFPQDAIGQLTDVVVYFPLIAIMLNMREIDKKLTT